MESPEMVQVTFRHADTGETIAVTQVPAESLPEDLSVPMNLSLNEEPHMVVSANPTTRAGARLRGELEVLVRPFETLAVPDTRAALPTVENQMPALDESRTLDTGEFALIHEDDWRQMELIAEEFETVIAGEIEAIRAVTEGPEGGTGFEAIHVRHGVPNPLAGREITLDRLRERFPRGGRLFDGLTFDGEAHPVAGGFAVQTPGRLLLYGLLAGERLEVLGVILPPPAGEANADVERLFTFAKDHRLLFVNWCGRQSLRPM